MQLQAQQLSPGVTITGIGEEYIVSTIECRGRTYWIKFTNGAEWILPGTSWVTAKET